MRGIGEPAWSGRSDAELAECNRHESLLNLAFTDAPGFTLLCPYDADGLSGEVLDGARRNHPRVSEGGHSVESEAYVGPENSSGPFDGDLPRPSVEPDRLAFSGEHLSAVRRFAWARR